MAVEIERKFLVVSERWREHVTGKVALRDGLIARDIYKKVRVRSYGDRATLTVKSRQVGMTRDEFEYEIPVADAAAMFKLCGDKIVEKTRYFVPWRGHTWEIDVYHGVLEGVVTAEVELVSESSAFEMPAWIGAEVTNDPRYKKINMLNERLARRLRLQVVG